MRIATVNMIDFSRNEINMRRRRSCSNPGVTRQLDKTSSAIRIVNERKRLPQVVIEATSVPAFESRLQRRGRLQLLIGNNTAIKNKTYKQQVNHTTTLQTMPRLGEERQLDRTSLRAVLEWCDPASQPAGDHSLLLG